MSIHIIFFIGWCFMIIFGSLMQTEKKMKKTGKWMQYPEKWTRKVLLNNLWTMS